MKQWRLTNQDLAIAGNPMQDNGTIVSVEDAGMNGIPSKVALPRTKLVIRAVSNVIIPKDAVTSLETQRNPEALTNKESGREQPTMFRRRKEKKVDSDGLCAIDEYPTPVCEFQHYMGQCKNQQPIGANATRQWIGHYHHILSNLAGHRKTKIYSPNEMDRSVRWSSNES